MKNPSTKTIKVILGLIMSVGSQAFARNQTITADTLLKNNIEIKTIQDLIDEEILLKTNIKNSFEINNQKVTLILEASEDQELKQFVQWLRSLVGEDSQVSLQKPNDMTISSQDGGNIL